MVKPLIEGDFCEEFYGKWGKKEMSILRLNHFDQRGINFIRFFIQANNLLYWTRAYDPFLIVYHRLLLGGLTRQVLAQYNSGLFKFSSHSLDILLLY